MVYAHTTMASSEESPDWTPEFLQHVRQGGTWELTLRPTSVGPDGRLTRGDFGLQFTPIISWNNTPQKPALALTANGPNDFVNRAIYQIRLTLLGFRALPLDVFELTPPVEPTSQSSIVTEAAYRLVAELGRNLGISLETDGIWFYKYQYLDGVPVFEYRMTALDIPDPFPDLFSFERQVV